MRLRKSFFYFLLLLSLSYGGTHPALAQYSITGVARDSLTKEPLGFASVFLANTTYGATTDAEGRFTLPNVAAGKYDFIISYLGYRLYQRSILVQGPLTLTPRLVPSSTQLGEVVVRARKHVNNPEDYRKFEQMFLGTTSFSRQCRILNPKEVIVDFNPDKNELSASSLDFVQVENKALGYRIKYFGLHFRVDFTQQVVTFYGQPVFEDLPARNARQRQRWAENRKAAYLGSLAHFLRSIYDDQVTAQGYLVQKTRRVTNPRRAHADSLVRQKIAAAPPGTQVIISDTLQQMLQEAPVLVLLYTRPLPIDSLRRLVTAPSGPAQRWLRFHDQLQVTYEREKPDPLYHPPGAVGGPPPPPPTTQISTLYLMVPEAQIQPNGQLMQPLAVFTEGYWAFEKMGEFLPLDYEPPEVPQ